MHALDHTSGSVKPEQASIWPDEARDIVNGAFLSPSD